MLTPNNYSNATRIDRSLTDFADYLHLSRDEALELIADRFFEELDNSTGCRERTNEHLCGLGLPLLGDDQYFC